MNALSAFPGTNFFSRYAWLAHAKWTDKSVFPTATHIRRATNSSRHGHSLPDPDYPMRRKSGGRWCSWSVVTFLAPVTAKEYLSSQNSTIDRLVCPSAIHLACPELIKAWPPFTCLWDHRKWTSIQSMECARAITSQVRSSVWCYLVALEGLVHFETKWAIGSGTNKSINIIKTIQELDLALVLPIDGRFTIICIQTMG